MRYQCSAFRGVTQQKVHMKLGYIEAVCYKRSLKFVATGKTVEGIMG